MNHGPFVNAEEVVHVSNNGERYVPLADPYQAAMHLGHMASYKQALRYAYGRWVLDLGCGTGYGSHYLASFGAAQVVAADVDVVAINYARTTYTHPRIHYLRLEGNQALPFVDHAFDFVFSSQVIEHIVDPVGSLHEIRRVLKVDGFCLIITPNKDLFSPGLDESSNEFHVSEMNLSEYEKLGRQVFPHVAMAGIPQNCLIRNPDNTVSLKPNERIALEDYQMLSNNLSVCENLLLFGHTQAEGQFDVTLPEQFLPASDNLAPCFWDPSAQRWITLGVWPPTSTVSIQTLNTPNTIQACFRSPYDNLYRIDIALVSAGSCPIEVTLRRDSVRGQIVFRATATSLDRKLCLTFAPVTDSERKAFYLELGPRCGFLDRLLKRKTLPRFGYCGDQLAIWTFHQTLPPVQTE